MPPLRPPADGKLVETIVCAMDSAHHADMPDRVDVLRYVVRRERFAALAVHDGTVSDNDIPSVVWLDKKGATSLMAVLKRMFPGA